MLRLSYVDRWMLFEQVCSEVAVEPFHVFIQGMEIMVQQ
jgi:hypothetical protein